MITLLISLIVLIIICSLVWWALPIILPDVITPRNKQRIAILVCILLGLIWLSGGLWSHDVPWFFYARHR